MKNSRHFSNLLWGIGAVFTALALVTLVAFWALARGNMAASRILFEGLSPITWVLSRGTGRLINSIEVWNESVWLGRTSTRVWQAARMQQEGGGGVKQTVRVALDVLPETTTHIGILTEKFEHSWLLSKATDQHAQYARALRSLHGLLTVANQAVVDRSRFVVLLQNTDEIRATGGFMGSYAVLDFGSDNPFAVEMRDIYDPSGQSISLPSPPGQREYLSQASGMKLVDANWNPDFPVAASTILEYFRQIRGDSQQYDGVIAVPLTVVEELVDAVGGIYVADENQTFTADQFAALLREDRGDFFPGSRAKTQSLASVYTALTLKLSALSTSEWQQVAQRLFQTGVLSEIQVYSTDPTAQAALHAVGADGSIAAFSDAQFFIFPVESNVGINKANRKVFRSLRAQYEPGMVVVTTEFRNDFTVEERPAQTTNLSYTQADHLGYANYYRFLVSPNMRMTSVEIDGKPAPTVDEEEVITSSGLPLTQIGFLVTLPESRNAIVVLRFDTPDTVRPEFVIQKQVGIAYDSVHISCFNNLHHSPLPLKLHGRLYRSFCGEGIQ